MIPEPDLVPVEYREAHRLIAHLFDIGLGAVDPIASTERALHRDGDRLTIGPNTVRARGRVVVVGMGKAATAMAVGAERALQEIISTGLVVTKDGHRREPLPQRIEVVEAAHPLPDERSLEAGERLLGVVSATTPDDVVVALISGGGSALAECLLPPLTLPDLRAVTDVLLRAGATIGELNTVRRALSQFKAGGLLARSAAPLYPLILSDVIGNDLGTIASGAVIPGPPLVERAVAALEVLARYELSDSAPESIALLLETIAAELEPETPADGQEPVFVGDNARAVEAIGRWTEAHGLVVGRPEEWQGREGEAAELGRAFVESCRAIEPGVDVVVGGGEATVTVRGRGVGGRNTEFALAAAVALAASATADWVIASLATDGQDGPTGVAGATADGDTVRRSRQGGSDPDRLLRENDSLRAFTVAGGLVVPGPTGTNVNDLYIGVRVRPEPERMSAAERMHDDTCVARPAGDPRRRHRDR